MKKLFTIALLLISLGVQAQTVRSQGKEIKLNDSQRSYLLHSSNKRIAVAISSGSDIKNNEIADIIIAELNSCKYVEWVVDHLKTTKK